MNWSDHTITGDYSGLKLTPLQIKILDTVKRYPLLTFTDIAVKCGCGKSHVGRVVSYYQRGVLGNHKRYKPRHEYRRNGSSDLSIDVPGTRILDCLRCDRPFRSTHKGNRLCPSCGELLDNPDFERDFRTHGYSIYSVFEDRA
jgi:hypothetical protein